MQQTKYQHKTQYNIPNIYLIYVTQGKQKLKRKEKTLLHFII